MLNMQTNELHDANFRIYNVIKLPWILCEFKMSFNGTSSKKGGDAWYILEYIMLVNIN